MTAGMSSSSSFRINNSKKVDSRNGQGIGILNVIFGQSEKYRMRPRDVNHASQRSEDEAGRLRKGLSDPCAQDIPNNCDTVGGLRRVKSKGECWLRDGAGWQRIRLGLGWAQVV